MSNRYFKRNYDEIVDILTPSIYKERDIDLSGFETNPIDKVSAGIINLINGCIQSNPSYDKSIGRRPINFSSTFDAGNFDLNTFSGLAALFVPQNNLTELSPRDFELKILNKVGKSFSDFSTSAEFKSYLSGTLLPTIPAFGIRQRRPATFVDLDDTTASAFSNTASGTNEYLSDALSWFYYLNQDAGYGPAANPASIEFYDPSSALLDLYCEKLFQGQNLTLNDAIKAVFKFLWYNQDGRSVSGTQFAGEWIYGTPLYGDYIHSSYSSGIDTWTSGSQQLDRYLTLIDVIYGNKYSSGDDTYMRDLLQEYFDSSLYPDGESREAPFSRFMKAVSFMFADINEYNEKLRAVKSIDDCPPELLPYLADIIGWKFYNNDISSWRRQLRNAVDLYKKKGTKDGLVALINSILPGTGIDFQEAISEFYESYIPQLMFYLLATASPQFDSLESWTHKKSLEFNNGEYDPANLETNIRYTVDHILLRAVKRFPDLFNIRGYRFNPEDRSFRFNYRGRAFEIPPWEEEKFYTDCDLNEDLVSFFSEELKCLGVSSQYVDTFKTFVLSNTVSGNQPIKKYNSTFLFFTDVLNTPPNHDHIINSFDKRRLKYLPMWNAKSSHFDFTVSGGGFDMDFFQSPNYNRYDFTNSLASVEDFSPAKAIPRVHVDISGVEQISSGDYFFPKVKYSLVELQAPSGLTASWQASSLDMRDSSLGLRGRDIYTPSFVEDPTKTHIIHGLLPCFKREQIIFGQARTTRNPLTASGPYTAEAPRTAVRRRDHSKTLTKGEWYARTGYNQPTFYNGVSSTTVTYDPNPSDDASYEFLPLGWQTSSYSYTPVVFPVSGVWDKCETVDSSSIYKGVETSACYEIRGAQTYANTSSIEKDQEHFFVDRSNLSEVVILINKLIEEKTRAKAAAIYERNSRLLDTSSFRDSVESLTNYLMNTGEDSISNYYDFEFGQTKPGCKSLFAGIHRLYDAYIKQLGNHPVADAELNSLEDGGLSVISHAFGPLAYNAKLTVRGSEYDSSHNRISGAVSDEYVFSLANASLVDAYDGNTLADLYVGEQAEKRSFGMLSGVEVVDLRTPTGNVMSCFNLSADRSILGGPTHLVGKNFITMKPIHGLPRLRYHIGSDNGGGGSYGPRINKLVPEHDFSFEVSSQFLEEYSNRIGGGTLGVWIHTVPENDVNGNKVFWNYMPDGTWKMYDASYITGNRNGITRTKNELAHTFDMQQDSVLENVIPCYEDSEPAKLSLLSLDASNLTVNKIKFDTKNRPVKVPLNYFQAHNQVHRLDQSYVVEVFPITAPESDTAANSRKYWMYTGMQIVDNYFNYCTKTNEVVEIPDFSKAEQATVSSILFYKPDGSTVPSGTAMYVNEDGEILLNGEKITYAFTSPVVQTPEKPKLYSKVYAYIKSRWVTEDLLTDSPSTEVFIDTTKYVGEFAQQGDYLLSPEELGMQGLELGSHMVVEDVVQYPVSPENLLRAFRHFRYVSEEISSRDNSKTEDLYGTSGGGRMNYRIHPASYQNDTTWFTDNRYNELEFYN